MTVFTFSIEWDQAINYQFDQDDIKTVGKRRVSSSAVVVAPDKELAELFLRRGLRHASLEITGCQETVVNIFVEAAKQTFQAIPAGKVIGAEVIDPMWQARMDADRQPY